MVWNTSLTQIPWFRSGMPPFPGLWLGISDLGLSWLIPNCSLPDVRICMVSNFMDFRCFAAYVPFTCGMTTEVSDLLRVCNRCVTDTESFFDVFGIKNRYKQRRERQEKLMVSANSRNLPTLVESVCETLCLQDCASGLSPVPVWSYFLGAFAWNNLAPTRRIFMKFEIWALFENLSRKFKFHSYRTRITGTLREHQCTFLYLARFSLEWEMFRTKVVQKNQTIDFMFSNFFFNGAGYEIMWKNVVEPERPQTDNMAHAHFTLDTQGNKHTLWICNTYWYFLCNSGCMKAPKCYVLRRCTVPVFYILK
jgi:hypothetical protein